MTPSVLQVLRDDHAFDHIPRFDDLGVYHVPFDSMFGNTRVEERLCVGARNGERIAVVADSGCGKSSVISHVLGPLAEGIAPILVSARGLGPDVIRAQCVADAILSELGRQARAAQRSHTRTAAVMGDRRSVIRQRSRVFGAGVPLPLWLNASIAYQITEQTETSAANSLADKVEVITQCLDPIHADGLMPVVVFDDTDRWIGDVNAEVVAGFFGDVIRWFADLPVSLVVATHRRYLSTQDTDVAVLANLNTRIDIPRVPSVDQLARILQNRVEAHTADPEVCKHPARLDEVMDYSAVATLFDLYEAGAPLRRVMLIAHIAVVEAADGGSRTIEARHIRAAELA